MKIAVHKWMDLDASLQSTTEVEVDEVRIIIAAVPDDETRECAFRRLLNHEERGRASRFRNHMARREYILARVLLRRILAHHLHLEQDAVAIGYRPRGKPFLQISSPGSTLHFNLSHSGGWVAIALTRGREIGVDIESTQCLENWVELAPRILSRRQFSEFNSLPADQQREAFFNAWTRKEAYLKATGEGLTDDLPAIETTMEPVLEPEILRLPPGSRPRSHWAIRSIPLPPQFSGAVVFEKETTTARTAFTL